MANIRYAWSIVFILALMPAFDINAAQQERSEQDGHYFPETGRLVSDRFFSYWSEHGGLRQQGYPISEAMLEVSDTDGRAYIVQYFERAVFEAHPENEPPNDVLLSLLGVATYRERYQGASPDQKANFSEGSVYFPETGKRLGGSFLKYWNTFGGLRQHGYPISDEMQEKSEIDGNTYTVQYFERSVMEWHPGNLPPNDVLLSLIGTIKHKNDYPVTPGALKSNGLLDTQIKFDSGGPIGSGRFVFYFRDDSSAPGPYNKIVSVYGYDLQQDKRFLISNQATKKTNIATDGKRVVWVDSDTRIDGYDLSSVRVTTLAVSAETQIDSLALHGDDLFYTGSARDHPGLYPRDLKTGSTKLIHVRGTDPVTGNGMLLWTEHRSDAGGVQAILHVRDLATQQDREIVAVRNGSFTGYSISGNSIVWTSRNFDQDLRLYEYLVDSGVTRRHDIEAGLPIISGDNVLLHTGPELYTYRGAQGGSVVVYNLRESTSKVVHSSQSRMPSGIGLASDSLAIYLTYSDINLGILHAMRLVP
jgi:hypothetical protein